MEVAISPPLLPYNSSESSCRYFMVLRCEYNFLRRIINKTAIKTNVAYYYLSPLLRRTAVISVGNTAFFLKQFSANK